ncbi:MAG: type II toxin-antitoxin system RelE/ParE family toxin [Candidatus Peregrinibacteria bacterium]
MNYRTVYTKHARADLAALDEKISGRIVNKIRYFRLSGDPLSYAKVLKGGYAGKYRFRIGDYRAIFKIDGKGNIKILMILRIKHRKDVYGL